MKYDIILRSNRLFICYDIGVSHDRLVACCMSYITMKDILLLENSMSYIQELSVSYPFLQYASTYVLYHGEETQKEGFMQQDLVQQLQLPHYFYRLNSFHDAFQADISLRYGGAELLYGVSLEGYFTLVVDVLDSGADINAKGGYYGVHYKRLHVKGINRLRRSCSVEAQTLTHKADTTATQLQAASASGHYQTGRLLLEKGADVNPGDELHDNALLLFENGADVNAQGGLHGTALQVASAYGYP
jgi:hypothetical protein